MKVRYRHQVEGLCYGNIIWFGKFPMRAGRFPHNHPCAPGDSGNSWENDSQFGLSPSLQQFRERGYWASCFPDGDGITMKAPNDYSAERVARDISECFGWEVTIVRSRFAAR